MATKAELRAKINELQDGRLTLRLDMDTVPACSLCSFLDPQDDDGSGDCRHCAAYSFSKMHYDTCPGRRRR